MSSDNTAANPASESAASLPETAPTTEVCVLEWVAQIVSMFQRIARTSDGSENRPDCFIVFADPSDCFFGRVRRDAAAQISLEFRSGLLRCETLGLCSDSFVFQTDDETEMSPLERAVCVFWIDFPGMLTFVAAFGPRRGALLGRQEGAASSHTNVASTTRSII